MYVLKHEFSCPTRQKIEVVPKNLINCFWIDAGYNMFDLAKSVMNLRHE